MNILIKIFNPVIKFLEKISQPIWKLALSFSLLTGVFIVVKLLKFFFPAFLLFAGCTTFKVMEVKDYTYDKDGKVIEEKVDRQRTDLYTAMNFYKSSKLQDSSLLGTIYKNVEIADAEKKKIEEEKRKMIQLEKCKNIYYGDDPVDKSIDRDKYSLYLDCIGK